MSDSAQAPHTKRILVVDKTASHCNGIAAPLRSQGYFVQEVPGALPAIISICDRKPDLIVLSLDVPEPKAHAAGADWDKFLVISWAGRLNPRAAIPFVVVGEGGTQQRDRALELGAMDYISRQAGEGDLLAAVNRAIGICSAPRSAGL